MRKRGIGGIVLCGLWRCLRLACSWMTEVLVMFLLRALLGFVHQMERMTCVIVETCAVAVAVAVQ